MQEIESRLSWGSYNDYKSTKKALLSFFQGPFCNTFFIMNDWLYFIILFWFLSYLQLFLSFLQLFLSIFKTPNVIFDTHIGKKYHFSFRSDISFGFETWTRLGQLLLIGSNLILVQFSDFSFYFKPIF